MASGAALPADIRDSRAALGCRRAKVIRGFGDAPARARLAPLQDLRRFTPPASPKLVRTVHHTARMVLGELSLQEGIGITPDAAQTARASAAGANGPRQLLDAFHQGG